MKKISTKICFICKVDAKTRVKKGSQFNECLHWHSDSETGDIWCWCQGKCKRGYSIYQYVAQAGLKLNEFLNGDFDFVEAKPNEVNQMNWPSTFLPLSDPRSEEGVEYIRSRGLDIGDGMYFDTQRRGIVFPYYFENTFCGAQIRLINPWVDEDGCKQKIDTMPGTRLGLLFYGWNQGRFLTNIRGLIVTEGAFNAIAIQQALDHAYGGVVNNPWKAIASSGTGISVHKMEVLKEIKDQGIKVILAPDSDEAGLNMFKKCVNNKVISHYNFTSRDDMDWNDVFNEIGKDKFAKHFLGSIKGV